MSLNMAVNSFSFSTGVINSFHGLDPWVDRCALRQMCVFFLMEQSESVHTNTHTHTTVWCVVCCLKAGGTPKTRQRNICAGYFVLFEKKLCHFIL